jgi:hypothetical protein
VAEAVEPPPAPERSRHAPRFALLTGALIGVAIGAIALAAVLIAGGRSDPDAGWSSWRPSNAGIDAAQEIADHVALQYRLPDGKQLVIATGGRLEIADLPVHLALRDESGAASIVEGDSVLFTLCGGATRCTIAGTPSTDRMLLLQREALELALYAFRYTDVENVVVLLPPSISVPVTKVAAAKGRPLKLKRRNTALLLRRDQFATSLDEPLRATLPADTPSVATVARSPETTFVNLALRDKLYGMSVVQGQDASAFLLLKPLE